MVATDGHSYEREAIQLVLRQQPALRKSPLTRELLGTQVIPNHNLRKRMRDHEGELLQAAEASRAALQAIQGAGQEPATKRACPQA